MARIGFCINGFAGDNRDYFPFEWVDDPAQDLYRPANLDFDTAFEYIHRAKGFRCIVNISTLDDTVDPPVTAELIFSQTADRVYVGGDETYIQESFRHNNQWPDFQYGLPDVDEFYGSAAVLLGSTGNVPLVYVSETAFSPFIFAAASIQGGDPGDRTAIAAISSIQETGWRESQVKGYYMSEDQNFILFEPGGDTDRYVTGEVRVEAVSYWTYSGIYNASTGAQEIFPLPTGF